MKKKHYTYRVTCSFEMQFTFTEDEVVQSEEGNEKDMEPSDDALLALEEEIKDELCQNWIIEKVDVDTDFEMLLGIMEADV